MSLSKNYEVNVVNVEYHINVIWSMRRYKEEAFYIIDLLHIAILSNDPLYIETCTCHPRLREFWRNIQIRVNLRDKLGFSRLWSSIIQNNNVYAYDPVPLLKALGSNQVFFSLLIDEMWLHEQYNEVLQYAVPKYFPLVTFLLNYQYRSTVDPVLMFFQLFKRLLLNRQRAFEFERFKYDVYINSIVNKQFVQNEKNHTIFKEIFLSILETDTPVISSQKERWCNKLFWWRKRSSTPDNIREEYSKVKLDLTKDKWMFHFLSTIDIDKYPSHLTIHYQEAIEFYSSQHKLVINYLEKHISKDVTNYVLKYYL